MVPPLVSTKPSGMGTKDLGQGPEGLRGEAERRQRHPRLGGANFEGGVEVIHLLLVIAAVLFVLWLLFHAAGALVNLIWLAIIVLVVIWLIGLVRGRSTTS